MRIGLNRALAPSGLGALLVLAMAIANAGNLDFLSKAPVSYFNDEDMKLLKDAVAQVLDDTNAHAKKTWSNPSTGNSGDIEARGAFKTAAGVTCKRVRVTNRAQAVSGQSTYIVCQDPEKGWAVDQTAKPG